MQYRIHREGDAQNTPSSASTPVDNWERNTLREVLLAAYQEQRRARIWRNIWRGVAVLIFLSLIFGLSEEEGKTTSIHARSEHTAVIDLTGEIGNDIDDQVQILRDSMEAAYNNGNAKAIIIRANSPGGSPVVSNTAFNEAAASKPNTKTSLFTLLPKTCALPAATTLPLPPTKFTPTLRALSAASA